MKERPTYTIIGDNTKIDGSINIEGSLMVAGIINGDVTSSETVRVAESARIAGRITAKDVFLNGKVGNGIYASGRVILGAESHLSGDLVASRLVVEEGAVFTGATKIVEDEPANGEE